MPITKKICYLGTLEKLLVNSHIFERLRRLREAMNHDFLTRNEYSLIFQSLLGQYW